jgi:hypothetical protein
VRGQNANYAGTNTKGKSRNVAILGNTARFDDIGDLGGVKVFEHIKKPLSGRLGYEF